MKQIACLLFSFLTIGTANAQVAQWLVPPEYDWIEVSPDNGLIVAQQGFNHHIWDMNSHCLAKVTDDLYPFSEGYAVTTTPETANVTAVYDVEGKKTVIKDRVQLGWGYPLFHDGFLLVNDGNYFYYMDNEGGFDATPYYQAYPFSHGYASCFTFVNLRKMKDPMHMLIDTSLEPLELDYEGKMFPANDIEFISSVSDDGVAIIAYKGKLYYFDAATTELSPVLPLSGDTNIKNQARMDGDIEDAFKQIDDSTKVLMGKCGKSHLAITIEAVTLKPVKMTIGDDERSFQKKSQARNDGPTVLKAVKDPATGKFALHMGGKEILSPQLDGVEQLKGNTALVTMNDKLGLLRVNANDSITFKFNNDQDLGFRHKYFNTTIRMNMPPYINAEEASFEIDPATGCNIDKLTKEAKNNTDGSYVQYNCKILCPPNIVDTLIVLTYPVHIAYQGLHLPMATANVKAWHSKYFFVDVKPEDVNLTGNTVHFIVSVSAERVPGEEVFPFIPSLTTEGLRFEMEKVSDTRYKCSVYDLKPGNNNIVVRVTEEGCPPADYTFEVNYQPSTPKKERKVTITKKNPHLKI